MNYDFYADESDKITLLNYIFNETDLQIFELSSNYEETVKEYKNITDITSNFDLKNKNIHFQLWSPQFKAEPIFRRIELNPRTGYTFRFNTNGWGLIQLYLGGIVESFAGYPPHLSHSHLGHFNEQGAIARQMTNHLNGIASDWDWKAVRSASSKLKYHIDKKLSIRRNGSVGILPGAGLLQDQGLLLRH